MNRTKNAVLLVPVLFALLLLNGCVSPGADPVVVHAERTTKWAADVFDSFLKWEYDNREAVAGTPEIGRVADEIRRNGVTWLKTARSMTKAYKENRTPENRANLDTALAVLSNAVSETQHYLPTQ